MRTVERPAAAEITDRYEFMMSSAQELGERALSLVAEGHVEVFTKPDTTKVTTVDIALNKLFLEMVKREYPDDLVWGEEESNSEKGDIAAAEQHWMWTLDPIDGTSGFWRSYQNKRFRECTSTTMIAGFAPGAKAPTMGVIHNPFQRQRVTISADPDHAYYQTSAAPEPRIITLGEGAPRHLEDVRRFEQSNWRDAEPDLAGMQRMIPYARLVKHQLFLGSVALGDVDLSAFPGPSHPHDVAPGALIVRNAGGHVETFSGEQFDDVDWRVPVAGVVAAPNPELAKEFVAQY